MQVIRPGQSIYLVSKYKKVKICIVDSVMLTTLKLSR